MYTLALLLDLVRVQYTSFQQNAQASPLGKNAPFWELPLCQAVVAGLLQYAITQQERAQGEEEVRAATCDRAIDRSGKPALRPVTAPSCPPPPPTYQLLVGAFMQTCQRACSAPLRNRSAASPLTTTVSARQFVQRQRGPCR